MTALLPILTALAFGQTTAGPSKLVGTSRSAGNSPLTITLTEVEGSRWLVEVRFDEFSRTTIEQVVPTVLTCQSAELAGGHELVPGVTHCFNARLPDVHPVYDYEDKTRVRCVFADSVVAACKLQYTGWFPLVHPEPPPEPVPDEVPEP